MKDAGRGYRVEIEPSAEQELDALRVFDARPIMRAIWALEHEAETETRNRRPLRRPVADFPDASWEVRVRAYRVLYEVRKERIVRVLGVILKGRRNLDDAAKWGRRE